VALRKTRRMLGLARRCRVVLWGLPDGGNRKDPAVAAVLAPLTGAGFRVERVVTPCNALAALARKKPVRGDGPACWVAINGGGVAIVAIRPGQLLYSHSFPWDSTVGASGSQARLLQRYSLVAYLSPEIQRAMHAARALGFPIGAVVTCGNLPDLRSLTMPLIEELDVEVETLDSLDSLDGLVVKPAAAERLTEMAAAIRLACAGVIARATRPWDGSRLAAVHRTRALIRAAALVALLAGLVGAYFGYDRWRKSQAPPPAPVTRTAQTLPPPPTRGDARGTSGSQAPSRPASPGSNTRPASPAVAAPLPATRIPALPPGTAAPPQVRTSRQPSGPAPAPASRLPAPPLVSATPPQGRRSSPPAAASAPPRTPVQPRATTPPAATAPAPPAATPAVDAPAPAPGFPATLLPRWSPQAPGEPRGGRAPVRPQPQRLKDPLPRVTAILVSNEGRFATVGAGQIVGVGDAIGRRVVVSIDERALTLREPSGIRIRVGLGGRLLDATRGG
jgi:hypothetical protein